MHDGEKIRDLLQFNLSHHSEIVVQELFSFFAHQL